MFLGEALDRAVMQLHLVSPAQGNQISMNQ